VIGLTTSRGRDEKKLTGNKQQRKSEYCTMMTGEHMVVVTEKKRGRRRLYLKYNTHMVTL